MAANSMSLEVHLTSVPENDQIQSNGVITMPVKSKEPNKRKNKSNNQTNHTKTKTNTNVHAISHDMITMQTFRYPRTFPDVPLFCGRRPLPFGGSHLRLPSGPAGIRTTTGSLSALARPAPYQLSHRVARTFPDVPLSFLLVQSLRQFHMPHTNTLSQTFPDSSSQ